VQFGIGQGTIRWRYVIVRPTEKQSLHPKSNKRVISKSSSTFSFSFTTKLNFEHVVFFSNKKKRILDIQQIGLIDFWDTWFRPMPPQCEGKPQNNGNGKKKKKLSPLSLNNLTGAFVVLLVGLTLSLFVFLVEHIVALSKRHRSFRTTKSQQDPNNSIESSVHLDTINSAKMREKK
jgi:hypothetical protein